MISLPDIGIKLKELIDDPAYSMADVALLVDCDPGMATRFHPKPTKANHFTLETASLHLSSLLLLSNLEKGIFGEGAFTVHPTVWSTTSLTEKHV